MVVNTLSPPELDKRFHFISGFPRSGSTLLASILRQNPMFEANISTPVGRIVTDALGAMGPYNEAARYLTKNSRVRILQGIISAYYADTKKDVVFDNNRRWVANTALLAELYPSSKIICCLRSPAAVVDSFEVLFRKNPTYLSVAYGGKANLTVYERVGAIMASDGVVGFSLNAFRDAFYGPHRKNLLLVNYDDLCRFPRDIFADLHEALGYEPFEYDFEHIENIPGSEDFDNDVATPGLHVLKPKVVYEERTTCLPPDIFNNLPKPFWIVNKEATTAL